MAWYSTGTVVVTNGSKTVTGTGTAWFGALQQGWGMVGPDGRAYEIDTVDSATEVTLQSNYQGSTASAQGYSMFPTMSLANEIVDRLNTLISNFQGVVDGPGAGKFPYGTEAEPAVRFEGDPDTGIRRSAANEVALVAGGTDQLKLSGGKASGAAVQSSETDAAAGKLMKVGAFGWGNTSLGPFLSDLNAIDMAAGTYRFTSNTVGDKPAGQITGAVLVQRGPDANSVIQIAVQRIGANISFRSYSSGSWSAWKNLIDHDSIIGTVSQSGGVPTGAIIERGSNPNGEFVKYADGTMICWSKSLVMSQVVATYMRANWTYPATFIDGASISHTPKLHTALGYAETWQERNQWGANSGNDLSGTTGHIDLAVSFGAPPLPTGATMETSAIAIGRWF